jgi:hypothetical protein
VDSRGRMSDKEFVYEHRSQHPLTRRQFMRRLGQHGLYALGLIVLSLVIGMIGYHFIAGQEWVDAFLNTSMLLGGMGPVGELRTDAAKIFAGLFALYAGLVFLAISVLMLTPVFHRLLHLFHWEPEIRK